MASRRPLVNVSGSIRELPAGDTLPGVRELLSAARTYYVRTDGSDSNTGLSNTAGGAFLTIQKAIDVASALDNGGWDITIQVADGTYSGSIALKSYVGSGLLILRGNSSSPANVLISTSTNSILAQSVIGKWSLEYFKVQTSTGSLIVAQGGVTSLYITGLHFGAAGPGGNPQVFADGAQITFVQSAPCTIAGGGGFNVYAINSGVIECSGMSITLTGTPAFTGAFAYTTRTGVIRMAGNTFNGASTGARYTATMNGVIDVSGAGASYLPGNAAGSTATGGQYA